jgi:hypothetical protein
VIPEHQLIPGCASADRAADARSKARLADRNATRGVPACAGNSPRESPQARRPPSSPPISSNSALCLRTSQHRSWRRWIAQTEFQVSAAVTDVPGARAVITLALAARGLIEIIHALGHPWASLVETLLLAILALGFFAAAPRSHKHRSGWLLSGAIATGLAIARLDDFIGAAITPTFPVTCLVVCIVLLLFAADRPARHRPRD